MNFNDDEIVGLLNRLLEMLHQADGNNQGSIVFNVYSSGSLHVDHVDTQNFYGDACPKKKTLPDPPCVGREKGDIDTPTLPAPLGTEQAMVLWRKAQAALLADAMAVRLGIKEKWKVFEGLWNRKNMYRDYYKALNLQQSLAFQDEIKKLFR